MFSETIDLYDFFKRERGLATGGQLKVYARTDSREIKKRIRPAVLIIPGGGYGILSDREAEPVALRYLNGGFCPFVLTYSLKTKYPAPLTEAMLAMAYIRGNTEKYGIDKQKVCATGFSAGGHLAGLLATVKEDEAELIGQTPDRIRPDGVILAYPVVTMGEYTHCDTRRNITGGEETLYCKLSVEKRVDKNSSPAFIWHTFEDDCVPVENSLTLANAYRRANAPFALHIFERGGHGLSLADDETCDLKAGQEYIKSVSKWFDLSLDWLKSRGFEVKTSE